VVEDVGRLLLEEETALVLPTDGEEEEELLPPFVLVVLVVVGRTKVVLSEVVPSVTAELSVPTLEVPVDVVGWIELELVTED